MDNDTGQGFVCLAKELGENSDWYDARPAHQTVFMTILLRCAFKEMNHNIQGNSIRIFPGQLCTTIRKLTEWCGKWISKNDVEGSIKYFSKVNFLRQEVRHGKTLITITQPDICKYFKKSNQTTSQTQVRQESDRSQTQKNKENKEKKENIYPTASDDDGQKMAVNGDKIFPLNFNEDLTQSLSDSNNFLIKAPQAQHNTSYQTDYQTEDDYQTQKIEKNPDEVKKKKKSNKSPSPKEEGKPKIAFRENILLTQDEYDKLLKNNGKDKLEEMFDMLESYKGQHGKKYKSDYHTMIKGGWVFRVIYEKTRPTSTQVGLNTSSQQTSPKPFSDKRKKIEKHFQGGNKYNGAECFIDDVSVAFQRGTTYRFVKFSEYGFWNQFENMLRNFDISVPVWVS